MGTTMFENVDVPTPILSEIKNTFQIDLSMMPIEKQIIDEFLLDLQK